MSLQVTEMLPNLRILDNVRFDPLYLARKAKGKDAEPEPPRRQKGMPQNQDKGWGERREGREASAEGKGKKRKMDDDAEGAPRKRSLQGKEREERPSAREEDGIESAAPAKKSRSHAEKKKKKREQAEKTEAAVAAVPAKAPKAVGGSLSDPTASVKDAPAATTTLSDKTVEGDRAVMVDPKGVPVTQVPKAVSAVAGVVEVVASTKKGKGARKGGLPSDRKRKDGDKRLDDGKSDVLALIAQEREKATSIGGWD